MQYCSNVMKKETYWLLHLELEGDEMTRNDPRDP